MSEQPDEPLSPKDNRRIDGFFDCIASLLAKRWLRDQHQAEEGPPPDAAASQSKET